ncbi:MAG TPA: hypothetical protein VF607_04370, partial [Verrucomicrobiae bacterium]
ALALAGLAGLLATGCRTYEQKNKIIADWNTGNLPAAVEHAKEMADDNAKNKDAIIWRLEQGAVLRAAGKYEDSNVAFDQAQQQIDAYAEKAKVRVGQETLAFLSNQAELDYEGRSYDGIMLNTYRALNYLALGDIEKARPEITRAYQRQQDAVEANKKRIEDAQKSAEESKDKEAIERSKSDPEMTNRLASVTANLDGLKAYADYVNPFTVYLDGLYLLANAADASDLEHAHKSLERAASYAPDNTFIKQDLATADDVLAGQKLSPTTYVIYETGCAPVRGQIRIDIPIIISKVSYVGASFPTLKLQDNYSPILTINAGGASVVAQPVASMDSVVATDFKNDLPVVITKTVAATVVKAAAAYAINDAAGNSSGGQIAGLVAQVATAAYQIAVNIADTRTWTTLPKEFQVARIPTPADHKIDVATGTGQHASCVVGDGLINVVYVKSINPGVPLIVNPFKLK